MLALAVATGSVAVIFVLTERGTSADTLGTSTSSALQPASEVVSTAIVQKFHDGPPISDSLSRTAITLTGSREDAEMLTATGSAFECWQGYLPSEGPCSVTVNGVLYTRSADSAKWTAQGFGDVFPRGYSPSSPMNNLAAFERVVDGAVTRMGAATISGVRTTEYRAEVSLVKLYLAGLEGTTDLLSAVYVFANPTPGSPFLVAPVTVWANGSGQLLQVESSQSRSIPADLDPGSSKSDLVTVVATITLSDFGVAVHAVAPPASEVTFRKLSKPAEIDGTVVVRSSTGRELHERGLLELQFRVSRAGVPETQSSLERFVMVPSSGSFSSTVPSTSIRPGTSLQLAGTFYPSAEIARSCATLKTTHFATGATTSNLTLEC